MVATAILSPPPQGNGYLGSDDSRMDTTTTTDSVVDTPTVQPLAAYPLVNSQPPVRAIDGHQLFELHQKYVTTPLPTKAMFPWLHGVDGTSNSQNYFFGIQHQHYAGCAATGGLDITDNNNPTTATATTPQLPLPEHRGLMFIHANELDLGRLVGSVSPSEILQPVPPSPQSSPASPSLVSPSASSSIEYSNGSTNNTTTNGSYDNNTNTNGSYDINNHPQLHHQHIAAPATLITQGDITTVSNTDWADISDDLASSALSSSSLPSTTSSSFNNNTIGSSNGATTGTGSGNGGTFDSSSASSSLSDTSHPLARKLQSSFMHSLSEGINIRNFKIQIPRYALLSDLIIYAKDGEQDIYILQLAKQISTAQEEVFRAMKEQYPQMALESRRQTFILTDSFAAFEAKYSELVAISSGGHNSKNKVDFWEQEREQMSLLTRASEIAPGIWLGNNSDVPQQNNANNNASALATPVTPGSSFQSYFFSSSSASSTISNATSLANSNNNNNNNNKSTAIPTTPPPETTNDYYPPLTPPSFSDQTNFHPSICVECRSGANAPTTFTLDRIKSNVACTPAPLSFKEIFHLECGGSLTAGSNPEAFPPSVSSLSNFARQENVDVGANQTMRRATAAGLVGGHQMINTMLQTQITHLVNMAFFINQVTDGTSVASTTASVASGLSSPTSPSSPPSSFNNGFIAGHRSPSAQQQQQRPHQVLIYCVDGYTETALLALATMMVHYRFTLAEAYVKMQTDLGRSFFVYPNDAIMMLEVESQIWQRLVSEKNGGGLSAGSKSAIPGASVSTSFSSSGISSLSSSMSSTSSSFFSSLLNMSNQPSQQGPHDGSVQQTQEQEQDSGNGGSMAMEGLESTPDPEPISTIPTITTAPPPSPFPSMTNNNFAAAYPFTQPEHLEKFGWFYDPEFEGSFPSRILPFLYLGNLAHASNPGLLKSLGIQYVLSVGEQAHGLNVHMGEVGSEDKSTQFMVKLVDDMYDNGVDPLWRHIENAVAFVDEARKNNTRVLIHCRVGVSRSATIVIAYLMAYYNLSLVDAYLLVRARRLSVIIQPNLLFMYELMQWEQQLRGRFDSMGWHGIAREVHHLNMYYIGN
ncbi:tyrosine/serine/threonine protein phosphatase pps1 [Mortierella hygrophila]|uniref:Tyrosine/serine/threonine protein phosphatase pps1 n=1 Tax=Mortierella hygrophila TaxID=979708 RepID=A0A9P6FHQ3_9FUNG|nr:tyrosine/serine/threonine protein phosphatase pps1 [Mortierella hygrophila]